MSARHSSAQSVQTAKAFCDACGAALSPDERRCSTCGSDLTQPEEDAPSQTEPLRRKRESNLASFKKERLALFVAGFVALVGLSVLGYQASVSGKKGFALSGAAGAGAQPQDVNEPDFSTEVPPPKVIADNAVLERIEILKAQYDKETDKSKKRLVALALSEIFIENDRLDLGGEWSLAAFEATDRQELKLLLRAANLYDDAQRYPIASRLYAQYLALDSANADARVDYAICLLNQGLQREGVSEMRRVVDEHPNHQKANLNLGILYAQVERWDEARKLWQKARDLNPNNDAGKRAAELLARYASP